MVNLIAFNPFLAARIGAHLMSPLRRFLPSLRRGRL